MFKETIGKITALVKKKEDGNNKKTIENLVVFLIILIVTIIVINMIWNSDNKNVDDNTTTDKILAGLDEKNITTENEDNLETKLEKILSQIDGVGNVSVLITYYESSEVILAYNEDSKNSLTEETDSSGGTRTLTETETKKELVYKDENGESVPITEKIVNPKIEGAIITAAGAGNATVKSNIVAAITAATGLETHKIQVFEMKK